jgi:hypothetical protein
MAVTHNTEWTIERDGQDAFDVCVDYTYRSGSPAHYGSLTYPGHPEEPGEVEIEHVWRKSDEHLPDAPEFELTDAEREKLELWLLENPPEPDYQEDF